MIDKRLMGLCSETKKYVFLTILMNWLALLSNILIILWIGDFINRILNQSSVNTLSLVGVVGLLFIRFMSNIFYGKFSARASETAKIKLRGSIYEKLLNLGMGYQQVEKTSTIVQIMVEGVEQLEIYFGRYLPQFFYALLAPLTLFVVLVGISLKVALVLLICVPIIPLSIVAIMKIAKRILKNYWNSYSNLGGTFLENLQGLTTLKVFDQDENYHKKMNKEAEDFRVMTMKVLSMQLNSINIMDLVAFGGAAAGTILGLIEFSRGELLVGQLIVIILLSAEFFIPMRLLGSYFHIAMNGMTASEKMFKLLDAKEKEEITGSLENGAINEIKFENVDFAYEEGRQILHGVNMNITPGGLTAIVGESGSGKSTLASLILKSYSPQKGKIFMGTQTLDEISEETIYSQIALVSTNSYIFNGTIKENLLIGNPQATDKEIAYVLAKTRLSSFVENLKEGIHTNVGEGGGLLSGGQKQRLALARAILANRQMMIFDEATSNIDVESEEAIWEVIYELAKEKTILVISHRLANVKEAKSIYVIKDGRVVEQGSHQELYDMKQAYYKMIRNQEALEKIREVN